MYEDDAINAFLVMVGFTAVICAIMYILGWFAYSNPNGGLAILLVCVVYGVIAALALIPIIGVFVQGYVTLTMAWPAISHFLNMEASWLTTLVFWIYIFYGLIITITTTKKVLRA